MRGTDVLLTAEGKKELEDVLDKHSVKCDRYFGKSVELDLWG